MDEKLIKCTKCKENKPESEFNPSNLAKKYFRCKSCMIKYRTKMKHNINYVLMNIFHHQREKDKNLPYSFEEFSKVVLDKTSFLKLWGIWKESDYDKMIKPCILRKNSKKPYTLDNLRSLPRCSTLEICARSSERPVRQIDPETGKELAIFQNSRVAAKMVGIKYYFNIHEVCKKKRGSANGWRWEYV